MAVAIGWLTSTRCAIPNYESVSARERARPSYIAFREKLRPAYSYPSLIVLVAQHEPFEPPRIRGRSTKAIAEAWGLVALSCQTMQRLLDANGVGRDGMGVGYLLGD